MKTSLQALSWKASLHDGSISIVRISTAVGVAEEEEEAALRDIFTREAHTSSSSLLVWYGSSLIHSVSNSRGTYRSPL